MYTSAINNIYYAKNALVNWMKYTKAQELIMHDSWYEIPLE